MKRIAVAALAMAAFAALAAASFELVEGEEVAET
jgi:hypothetical protein